MRKIDSRITKGSIVEVDGVSGWKEVESIHESGNWIKLKLWDGHFQMGHIKKILLNPTMPSDFSSFEEWINNPQQIVYL